MNADAQLEQEPVAGAPASGLLLRAHYQFQHGAFISELEESPPWIRIASDISPVPMWNHAAWLGRSGADLDPLLRQARADWKWESRRPIVYLVDEQDTSPPAESSVQGSGFERCDQEAWMVYEPEHSAKLDSACDLEIRRLQTPGELADFIRVFCAAFHAHPQRYGKVFQVSQDPAGPLLTQHYLGYARGEAVATATLISAQGLACIYNVGTLPTARQRGYAAQLTIRLIQDALAEDRAVFLQAEKGGGAERLYTRLGFRTAFVRTGYRLRDWLPRTGAREEQSATLVPAAFLEAIHAPVAAARSETGSIRQSVRFPTHLSATLQAFCTEQHVGLQTVWIAAWSIVLSRYSRQEQVSFGLAVSPSQPRSVVSITVAEQQTLLQWLRVLEVKLGESRSDPGAVSEAPFETTLCFGPLSSQPQAGASSGPLQIGIALADATLEIGFLEGKFERGAIQRLAGHFLTVVSSIAAGSAKTVAALEMLTPVERAQLLEEWSRTESAGFEYAPIYRLFELEAAKAPRALAVTLVSNQERGHPSAALTYGELNGRANRLARQLLQRGVGPETVVGLFMERSVEMIIGLLAVFKAGGVCLPLDPTYPRERLEFILRDAQAALILTDQRTRSAVEASGVALLCVPSSTDGSPGNGSVPEESDQDLALTSASSDGAYLIYTSGSTGQPKGVLIDHQALARHCVEARSSYGLLPTDRVLQFNSLAFDAAFEQVWGTLISGASLVLRGPEVWTVQEWGRLVDRCQLTVVDLPTAYWRQLLLAWRENDQLLPAHLPRLWLVGGEAMTPEALRLWRELPVRQARLLNVYGPTEATITATAFEITSPWLAGELPARVPIGRPRGARAVYVLDTCGRPVPIGVPGELHIGGPLLARGYLNRPELTREKFVPNPFSPDRRERLYKTGDLVRFLPGGDLEFVGRVDHQVKIRGFRVELGEIESALQEHPLLRESVVLLHESAGHASLVAYVVAKNGVDPSPGQLRAFLKRKLPDYMVPSRFTALRMLPQLPSGKIDRRALLNLTPEEAPVSVVGPRDPLELRLQLLFERILQRTGIGVDVSFFELGGDSLQALELIVEIERSCGKSLPLEVLYQTPSVQALAKRICEAGVSAESSSLVPLQTGGTRPPLFLVHTTPGDILGYGNLIYHLALDQPCYGFQSLGLLQPELSHRRIEQMADYYVHLLRSFQPAGPYYLAGWCYGGLVAVEMAQRLLALEEEVAFLGLLETVAPAPSLAVYPYYLHRLGCFLRMHPFDWLRYFQSKWKYYRQSRLANRMRFRRLEQTEGHDPASLEEQNRRLATLEHVYSTNLVALRTYRPRPYPGRVTLFNAEQVDPGVIPDPLYAWKGLASSVEVHVVPGDHDTMLTEPNVTVLAHKLDSCLRRVQEKAAAHKGAESKPPAYVLVETSQV